MNLEFLQALVNKQQDHQNTPRNEFQEDYASTYDVLASANEQVEKDLQNDPEYQRLSQTGPFSEFNSQKSRDRFKIRILTERKYQQGKKEESCQIAQRRLLIVYGEYVSGLPGCPQEIQNLFKPVQFKKLLDGPSLLLDQLVDLAVQTQWSID